MDEVSGGEASDESETRADATDGSEQDAPAYEAARGSRPCERRQRGARQRSRGSQSRHDWRGYPADSPPWWSASQNPLGRNALPCDRRGRRNYHYRVNPKQIPSTTRVLKRNEPNAHQETGNKRPTVATLRIMTGSIANPLTQSAPHAILGRSLLVNADCIEWLGEATANSVHAIVTDPPYGVKEYEESEIQRLRDGNRGGIWRLPPVLNGVERAPLPRFTALTPKERDAISDFFVKWAILALRVIRPGGHLFVASNAFLSQQVFAAIISGGWEFRSEMIRLVQTLRGGDRPKLFEKEFPNVCSLPRGCYEPWGVFRKPIPPKMKVGQCLREWQTGGLRCLPDGNPFKDVIASERTPREERDIADHPSLKPLSFLRQIVYAALPLGEGSILDPFAGSGSTVAAAELEGLSAVGIERDKHYFEMSLKAVPALIELRRSRQLQLV